MQDLCGSVYKIKTIGMMRTARHKKEVSDHSSRHRENRRVNVNSVERHCYAVWIFRVTPIGPQIYRPAWVTFIALEEHGAERTRTAIAVIRSLHDICNEVVAYVCALASSRTSISLVAHHIIAAITINFANANLRQPSSFHRKI